MYYKSRSASARAEKGGDEVEKRKNEIIAECPLFVCRECRTKAGWPHQSWCPAADAAEAGCPECFYHSHTDEVCVHPILKREERAAR